MSDDSQQRVIKYIALGLLSIVLIFTCYFATVTRDAEPEELSEEEIEAQKEKEVRKYVYEEKPLLPLRLMDENASITAARMIDLDFSGWTSMWISNEERAESEFVMPDADRARLISYYDNVYPDGGVYERSEMTGISDTYTLTNKGADEQTIRILYPFVSSLSKLDYGKPTMYIDNKIIEPELYAGDICADFVGAGGSSSSLNIRYFDEWESYADLLSDDTYFDEMMSGFPDFSDHPATIYEFTDAWGPEDDVEAGISSAYLSFTFRQSDNTRVFSSGFNIGRANGTGKLKSIGFSIPQGLKSGYADTKYLFVLGDDIEDLKYSGYAHVGKIIKRTKKVDAGVTINRYESSLENVLTLAFDRANSLDPPKNKELYYGLWKRLLLEHGAFSESPKGRYSFVWMGDSDMSDTESVPRIFWMGTEVTVHEGESITVRISWEENANLSHSQDYIKPDDEKGVIGYHLLTTAGSNMEFTDQSVVIDGGKQINVVRSDMDLVADEEGMKAVLEMQQPHYYIDVKNADGKP